MSIIRELSKDVIERIAAGEVVERPSSVVKELCENSIDAGASSISIDICEGGKDSIVIVDDGTGMDMEDLKLSVMRHATSKIKSDEDLWAINTMGFRGEALAAIGAISRLVIASRVNDTKVIEGNSISVVGGEIDGPRVAGCAGGTRIEVRDLFFNVPARQKFLKSANVEAAHSIDVVTELALANPKIRFEMSVDGKRKLCARAIGDDSASLKGRISEIIGERAMSDLIFVDEENSNLSIRGYLCERGRSGGKDFHLFINRRAVKDRIIMHAVSMAFGDRLERGAYPLAVLWIDIDPARVDVNVHPAKREVKFAESGAIHDFVAMAVKKGLANSEMFVGDHAAQMKQRVGDAIINYEARRLTNLNSSEPCDSRRSFNISRMVDEDQKRSYSSPSVGISTRDQTNIFAGHGLVQSRKRAIGQLGKTYILCEGDDGSLSVVDQHAAHERIGFDELKKQYTSTGVRSQRLIIPERVELDARSFAYLSENLKLFADAGFEIEPFGGTSMIVKSVPEIIGTSPVKGILERVASEIEEYGSSQSIEDRIDPIFAVIACHAQVRGGDRLSQSEMDALIADMERLDVKSCPHGRPAEVKVEISEIEKWFRRRS